MRNKDDQQVVPPQAKRLLWTEGSSEVVPQV